MPDLKHVGQPSTRIDGLEKVTGAATFVDDIDFGPDLLHAEIVESPHAHALIKGIDTSEAQEVPGVVRVVTGKDFPKLLEHATPAEKKELIRAWVEEIRLTPEQLEVAITYRVPEPVVNRLVAGARFAPDSDSVPVVTARWLYAGVKQGTREMVRVGAVA